MTEEKKGFVERTKEKVLDHLATLVLGAVGALLVIIGKALAPDVIPLFSSPKMQEVLAPLLGISIILNFILMLGLWMSKKRENEPRFKLKYGVYWDRDMQPFCPVCEKPMQWGEWMIHGFGLNCTKCNKIKQLANENGNPIMISEAREELRKMK